MKQISLKGKVSNVKPVKEGFVVGIQTKNGSVEYFFSKFSMKTGMPITVWVTPSDDFKPSSIELEVTKK